jgi:hypothetical protein
MLPTMLLLAANEFLECVMAFAVPLIVIASPLPIQMILEHLPRSLELCSLALEVCVRVKSILIPFRILVSLPFSIGLLLAGLLAMGLLSLLVKCALVCALAEGMILT